MKKRRAGSVLLVAALLVQILISSAMAVGFTSFQKIRTYQSGQFRDVPSNEWYADAVKTSYELGLFDGKSSVVFDPNGNLTIAEAIKLAACLHSIYYTGKTAFDTNAALWYRPYVDYALEKGIVKGEYANYNKTATRAEFAVIFAAAFPDEGLATINRVDDGGIPDISMQSTYASQAYKLYRAGILIGSDSKGSFRPQTNITRSEVAMIVTRMALPEKRQTITLTNDTLSGEEIYEQCSSSVFYIENYNASGKAIASGSGFFLSSNGLAVTNHHVIEDAASAKIRTTNGKVYSVKGIYDADPSLDLALLQIDGSGFSYLNKGDSTSLKGGSHIYTIGSPQGLENSISEGIIANPDRVINGQHYIQITAPISHGSSGGALLDEKGNVIGVTSAGIESGQNLNLAVPIHMLNQLSQGSLKPVGTSFSNLQLTVSKSTVSLNVGQSESVTFTQVGDGDVDSIVYRIGDSSVVSAKWGDWSSDGSKIPLTLTGKKAGSTTVKAELVDDADKVLASISVSVTVTGSSTSGSQYYAGYYPVLDYGAFVGAPLFYETMTTEGQVYLYRISDLPSDTSLTVDRYLAALEANGFRYLTGFQTENGNNVLVYEHNGQQILVYFGTTVVSGIPCIMILIAPE